MFLAAASGRSAGRPNANAISAAKRALFARGEGRGSCCPQPAAAQALRSHTAILYPILRLGRVRSRSLPPTCISLRWPAVITAALKRSVYVFLCSFNLTYAFFRTII